nr:hypothetical protein CoNPh38_CDS0438 [Staphylococcus phage S-CoN_Ph38]
MFQFLDTDLNKKPLTKQMLKIYDWFSKDQTIEHQSSDWDSRFNDFVDLISTYAFGSDFNTPKSNVGILGEQSQKLDYKKAMVGFSSGVDSTYQALYLQSKGYHVTLFHVGGLNKSYPDEKERAQKFANDFDMDIIVKDCKHGDSQFFVDNPVKNQLVLSAMIDTGVELGIGVYAMGNNVNEDIKGINIQYGLSDSIQSFDTFESTVLNGLYDIKLEHIKVGKPDIYDFIIHYKPKALKYVNSCITPHRFKRHLNKLNREKYNFTPLSDTRCMSCFKCSIEHIILDKLGYVEHNKELLQHCYDIIRKKSDTMFTTTIANKKSTNKEIERNIFND